MYSKVLYLPLVFIKDVLKFINIYYYIGLLNQHEGLSERHMASPSVCSVIISYRKLNNYYCCYNKGKTEKNFGTKKMQIPPCVLVDWKICLII